jgi:hypothetical protein
MDDVAQARVVKDITASVVAAIRKVVRSHGKDFDPETRKLVLRGLCFAVDGIAQEIYPGFLSEVRNMLLVDLQK